jgi:hypothetical protein
MFQKNIIEIDKPLELINLLKSIDYYNKYYKDQGNWEIYNDFLTFPEKDFFTLLYAHYCDDYIVFHKKLKKFQLIHLTYNPSKLDEYRLIKQFSTPQEVWEKVIKPDIEEYYGIKIDE